MGIVITSTLFPLDRYIYIIFTKLCACHQFGKKNVSDCHVKLTLKIIKLHFIHEPITLTEIKLRLSIVKDLGLKKSG